MKPAEEIKKGAECCANNSTNKPPICYKCPFYSEVPCRGSMLRDALTLIHLLEAERDAAVEDIRMLLTSHKGACKTCIHGEDQDACHVGVSCEHCRDNECPCKSCKNGYCNWQWRGVQKEDKHEL